MKGRRVEISVLGSVAVRRDGQEVELGPQLRRVLAILVAREGEVVSMDRLIDDVWQGDPPDGADGSVKTYITRLRRVIDPGRTGSITYQSPGYVLSLDEHLLDSEQFDAELDEANRLLRSADDETAIRTLTTALARWRGDAYSGYADEDWARPEAVRLEERRLEAIESLIEARIGTGENERAVADAQSLAESEPLRERPRALLMRALYSAGRQAEALREFRSFRNLLVEEAGLDPSADLVDLERRIGRSDPTLTGTVRALRGYELGERLGEGAFAVVHRAVQPGVGRDVAVKIIRAELADHPDFVRRFEQEAQIVAAIEHPHVVPLYDFWREPGAAYLVMRLLRGGSVEDALRARGPFAQRATADLLREIGEALSAAHQRGVVHRDVRPANVLLDENGSAYLADFGIAMPTATSDDTTVASPAYAAPEFLRGEPTGVAADVLSLGVMTFELLTGRLPFADSNDRADLIRRQLTEPLPPARATRTDLPGEVDEILARATAKAPEDRHANVAALVDELVGVLGGARRHAGPVDPARRRRGAAANPYVGLNAFTERDADRFRGREALVTEVVETLARAPFTVVVGPSGSGKSSVVRAGVVPALRRGAVPGSDEWFITGMLPGSDPIDALETALLRVAVNPPASLREQLGEDGGLLRAVRRVLPDDDARILLVVDQFEELFTMTATEDRARFLDELAAAITSPGSPLRVVATLRADHYDVPLRHAAFAEIVTHGTVAVRPMTPEELERAIVAPATSVGAEVEPALVAELVAGVTERPAALPLLQFALTETYERRVSDVLLASAYRELGGLTGAVAARADRIVDAGDPADEAEARRVFSRLVTLGDGTEDTRRRALRSEFGDGERTAWLLDALVTARLLTLDHDETSREPTVEVAHEALLRDWPRLRRWLDDDRDDLRTLRLVGNAAEQWARAGRDPGELARGGRLESALDLADRRPELLSDGEAEWIAASHDAEVQRSERELRMIEHDRRQNRRLRRLLGVAAVLVVLAVVAGSVALVQRSRAIDSEAEAIENAATERAATEEAELATLISRSAAFSAEDPDLSVLLALEANRRAPGPETEQAVLNALGSSVIPNRLSSHEPFFDKEGECPFIRVTDDAAFEFAVIEGDVLGSRDTLTGDITDHGSAPEPCVIWGGDPSIGLRVAGDVDATTVWIGPWDGPWTVESTFDVPTYWMGNSFGAEGRVPAISFPEDEPPYVSLLDAETGDAVGNPITGGDQLVSEAVSDDGSLIVVSFGTPGTDDPDGTTIVVDVETGTERFRFSSPQPAAALAFDMQAGELVAAVFPRSILTVDLETGEVIADIEVPTSSDFLDVGVRPDGLLSVITRGEARLVDRRSGPVGPRTELRDVQHAYLRPDGDVFVVSADDERTGVIDLEGNALVERTLPIERFTRTIFNAGLVSAVETLRGTEDVVEVIDVATRERSTTELVSSTGDRFFPHSVHPERDGFWAISLDNVFGRWFDGRLVSEFDLGGTYLTGTRFDDLYAYLWDDDGEWRAGLIDLSNRTAEVVLTIPVDDDVTTVHPTLGGELYVFDRDGTLRTFDRSGTQIAEVETEARDADYVTLDAATGRLAVSSFTSAVSIVDPETGSTQTLPAVESIVNLGFGRDGQLLVLTGADGTVRLWDVERQTSAGVVWKGSGASRGEPSWYDETTGAMWVAAGDRLLEIPLEPAHWIERACEVIGRDLTDDEWARFVPGDETPQSACGRAPTPDDDASSAADG